MILYLGLEVPEHLQARQIVHCPLIKIMPRPKQDPAIAQAFASLQHYTHLIFTSKSAVSIFMDYASQSPDLDDKRLIAVGKKTAAKLASYGILHPLVAKEETAEGVVQLLSDLDLAKAHVFWPHSSLSRPIITAWLKQQQVCHCACALYDTIPNIPETIPDLNRFDEIVFTSPSTIDAFLQIYKRFPADKTLTCIGPVTQAYLKSVTAPPGFAAS